MAEVNTYVSQQSQYGHLHPGEAVLIFVTEDFLTNKHVKNESGQSRHSTPVLKTNLMQHFTTGLYQYSIMTSVFTPTDARSQPHTLKINTSSQDWCGQSFIQLNKAANQYQVQQFSYFESEGDRRFTVPLALAEDELFNRIRLDPQAIATGTVEMLPGTLFTRLMHIDFKPYPVVIRRENYHGNAFEGSALSALSIYYPAFDRTLEIVYLRQFPFQIEGWTDTYPVRGGQVLTTTFRRKATGRMPYWTMHEPEDTILRRDLGL